MKKTKTLLCVLLVAMLMLSLTACVQQPDWTTGAASTTVPAGTGNSVTLDIDLNDQWVINTDGGHRFSEAGYYYLSDSFLYFMDTENGNSVILCSKAGCQHDKAEDWDEIYACEAFINGGAVFFYSDGYLYYDKIEQDNPNAIHLYRRNADGTAEKKVATLCEAYFSKTTSVEIAGYLCADGILYYSATIYGMVEEPPNNFVLSRSEVLLMRLDLTTGKEKEILRLKDTYIRPLAARKDALIYHRLDALSQDEMLNPDFEKLDAMPALLQVWTESSGTATTIFEKTDEQCTLQGIFGSKFYYSGRNEYAGVYAYDFATGEHTTTNLPENACIINENYWSVSGELNTTVYDFCTGKPVSGDFADWHVSFPELGENGFIADLNLYTGITPDGKLIIEREIYGYVPFAAMEDGLQKEDILIIYEEEY